MRLRLEKYNERRIADCGIVVANRQEFDVSDEIGQKLLAQNTVDFIIYSEVLKPKKKQEVK